MGRVYALAFHDWDSFLPFRARESLAPSLSREVVPSLTPSPRATLDRIVATGHEDFAQYHELFRHENAKLE
ncbi:Probable transposable element [Penicillium roqueforti FM164]|uniref:Probable transposable element n=1 Tax=Penicillium roqueforti (strain FM164) TaxID=1365484 RepID=W6QE84_PENRF|nr:Probable transposable element [Penicillium roqueforti FM164]